MKPQHRLSSQQKAEEQEAAANQQQSQSQPALEFASAEEMLRHDALHTPVPPVIAQRLEQSLRQIPPPTPRSWWRRWFGG
ncbi:MAG TPA: hypothetical protein VG146_06195 [Verrucomicrobiae bacterium]|nr:hypothetical protein [Verrucomicrobiae bacterium]